MEANDILQRLREIAPHVAVSVTREADDYFQWDGDGPDPAEDGYRAYDVFVEAQAVVNGALVKGHEVLGGSYFKPEEPCGDVHGYFPQMAEESLENLRAKVMETNCGVGDIIADECTRAIEFLSKEMQDRYEAQRRAEHREIEAERSAERKG